jgi:4-hydroxybenzoate polyprenyltransferase
VKSLLAKVIDCFFLLRIPLLVPVWTILLLGWVTGRPDAAPGGVVVTGAWDGPCVDMLWRALAGFSLIVAFIYVVNQIVDIESDRINHKLFLLPHGFVSVRTAWVLALLCATGGMAIAATTGLPMVVLFALSLLLGVLYNLPPLRLKDRPVGGVIANCLGHGSLTYLVGWYAAHCMYADTAAVLRNGLLASISPALANGAVFLASTIPDSAGDKATGKVTFCVRFGSKATSISAALLCAGALAAVALMPYHQWVMGSTAVVSLMLFVWLASSGRREVAFQAFRWPVLLLSTALALYVPLYGLALLATFALSRAYYRWRFGIEYPTFKSK